MKLTMIEQWAETKASWNAAFVSACETAERVEQEVKTGCGQCVLPGDLMISQVGEPIRSMVCCSWGKAKPVSQHWSGSLAGWKDSMAKLKLVTPEQLHVWAAELLAQ